MTKAPAIVVVAIAIVNMNAKTARDAMHEFISLLSGTDTRASQFLSGFPPPAPHRIIASSILTTIVNTVASNMQMSQPELDKEWRISFLKAVLALAAAGKPYVPILRGARARCDYVLFAVDPAVRDANTEVFKKAYNDIVAAAECVLPENLPPSDPSASKPDTLAEFIKRERLSDWVRRAVIADLINGQTVDTLSNIGRNRLTTFREGIFRTDVPDRVARSVFVALDRRGIWSEMEDARVTSDEVDGAAFSVCCTLKSIGFGTWEGDFAHYAHTGAFEPDYGVIEEYMHTEPEFEELGPKAWRAQRVYKQGMSIEESIAVINEMDMFAEMSASENSIRAERAQSHLAMMKDNSGMNPSEKYVSELKVSSAASSSTDPQSLSNRGPTSTGNETEEIRVSGKISRCEVLNEIRGDFGDGVLFKFLNIDYGMTGPIEAKVETVSSILQTAIDFKRGQQHFTKDSWVETIVDTDVLVIALSYKHQGKAVRMNQRTAEKISTAICQIAYNQGMSKVNIWLDAILSQNQDISDSSWAVTGLYPYLCCDVLRVIGNDNEYSDCREASMWMKVEKDCADEETMITLKLDESKRGFTFSMNEHAMGRQTVKTRMMSLAKDICKGELISKLASWREDKRNLIMWAECCMMQNAPVLMDDSALRRITVLRIDNMEPSEIKIYLQRSWSRGFIQDGDTAGIREGTRGWTGVFELLPGLREASQRTWIPLVPCADEGCKFVGQYKRGGSVALLGFGNFVVSVDMDREGTISAVSKGDVNVDDQRSFEDFRDDMRTNCEEEPQPLLDVAELGWGQENC